MNQINESGHTGLSTDPAAVLLLELAGGLEPPESQRTSPEFGNFVYLIHLTSGSCSFFQCHLLAHLLCARCYAGTPSVCKVLRSALPHPPLASQESPHPAGLTLVCIGELTRQLCMSPTAQWPWSQAGHLESALGEAHTVHEHKCGSGLLTC